MKESKENGENGIIFFFYRINLITFIKFNLKKRRRLLKSNKWYRVQK